MQDYTLLIALAALLAGMAVGKAWERYKLVEGRWIDRRRVRQSPHFILGLNYLVAGQVDLAIEELEKARDAREAERHELDMLAARREAALLELEDAAAAVGVGEVGESVDAGSDA